MWLFKKVVLLCIRPIITTIEITILLPKLVKQGFDTYNKITLIGSINLQPTSYREYWDIVIYRVTEKEIEEAFLKVVLKKKYKKKKRV